MTSLYHFIRDSYWYPQTLWASCRYECWVMASILPILTSDLVRPWSSELVCSDASTSGMGACRTVVEPGVAKALGEWFERWRFRRLDPAEWQPRKRAAGELDEVTDPRFISADREIRAGQSWALREGFPEVPEELMQPHKWKTMFAAPPPIQRVDNTQRRTCFFVGAPPCGASVIITEAEASFYRRRFWACLLYVS